MTLSPLREPSYTSTVSMVKTWPSMVSTRDDSRAPSGVYPSTPTSSDGSALMDSISGLSEVLGDSDLAGVTDSAQRRRKGLGC